VSSVLPGQGAVSALVTTPPISEAQNVFIPIVSVDYDFVKTYGMVLLAGRDFDRDAGTDHMSAFIANESAVKKLGFANPESAIGESVDALGKQATIIGVMGDYHFEGLQQPLRPLMLEVDVSKFATFTVRIANANIPGTIDRINQIWNGSFPEKPFAYQFLVDELDRSYGVEQRFGEIITLFSTLAIAISALGLIGLSAFVARQRERETAVRKVLGATTVQVFAILSKEFVWILLVAFVASVPLAYYFSEQWLNEFAYRIDVSWVPFAVAMGVSTVIAFLAIVAQTIGAATRNPLTVIRQN
jgi:putative ABC transport system permease protein